MFRLSSSVIRNIPKQIRLNTTVAKMDSPDIYGGFIIGGGAGGAIVGSIMGGLYSEYESRTDINIKAPLRTRPNIMDTVYYSVIFGFAGFCTGCVVAATAPITVPCVVVGTIATRVSTLINKDNTDKSQND